MKELSASDELKILIFKAEEKKIRLEEEIKSDIDDFIKQLRPSNLVKKGISSIAHTDHLKEKAVKAGVGIVAGYLFKKIFFKNIKRSMLIGFTGIVAQQLLTYYARPENVKKVSDKISEAVGKIKDYKEEQSQMVLP